MDVKTWFYDNSDTLYHNNEVAVWIRSLISISFSLIIVLIAYLIVRHRYNDPDYDTNLDKIRTLIKIEKKIHKGKAEIDKKELHKELLDAL